jgi:hypothetical protein
MKSWPDSCVAVAPTRDSASSRATCWATQLNELSEDG